MDTLTPAEVTAVLLTVGQKKVAQAYHVTFFKAWMAGWMLCFGAMVLQVINAGNPWMKTNAPAMLTLVGAVFFPIGLIMLVMTGQELCTANFMILAMTTVKRKTKVWELPVNWLIVFFGNLAGALCYVAFLAHYSDLYASDAMRTYSQTVVVAKTSQSWGAVVLRGIGCNFLVCAAIWLGTGARETISKIAALHFPIFAFVFLGFEHVIVNMFYLPIGLINGANVSVASYIASSMIPSLIGNIIGGLLLGVPMVLFYEPVAIPFLSSGRGNTSSIVEENVDSGNGTLGDNLPGPGGYKKA